MRNVRILNINFASIVRFFPALLSGFLMAIAFPGINLYPIAFVGLVPLFILIKDMNKKERLAAGTLAGLTQYIFLVYFLVTTLCVYGKLNIFVAVSALILICLYFALYFGLFAFFMGFFKFNSLFMPFIAASLWVALEYLRTYIFSGFPWCLTGYSQYLNNNFIQIVDITGIYGISFAIIFINALIALIIINFSHDKKKVLKSGIFIILIIVLFYSYGIIRHKNIDNQIQTASYAKVAVIQGDIRQDVKWDSKYINTTLYRYFNLSQKACEEKPDLIIWPETALPFYYGYEKQLSDKVDAFIRYSKTNYLIGSPAFKRTKTKIYYYNRVYMLNRFSIETGRYDKIHLIPFGEYVPLGKYLAFLGKLTAQSGDFTSGTASPSPLSFGTSSAGVLICFEIVFPSLSRKFVQNGAEILVTITNDGWFGKSSAAEQHFSQAVFRAIENRRSLARSANTGISGFIDPNGNVLEKSNLFVEAELVKKLPILKIKTFYTSFGDVFAILCCIAIVICFMVNTIIIPKNKSFELN